MHQFQTRLAQTPDVVRKVVQFLVPITEEGRFIFSFYDVPIEFWARISQLDFPCEIIVDLEDHYAGKPIPKEFKGLHVRDDKVICSFPFEFEQVLRAPVDIQDVAVIIDGQIADTKRLANALEILNIVGEHLSKLSDYTFTFWIEQLDARYKPPAGNGATISIDLDGVIPLLLIEVDDDRTHLHEIMDSRFRRLFEENTGVKLDLSARAKAVIHQEQAEGKKKKAKS